MAQVCIDFKHHEVLVRHTINIGTLFERPLELCVYLADCSTRLVHLYPTEADELEQLAEQFEKHACDMIDQCESGAEAEAALRTAGTARRVLPLTAARGGHQRNRLYGWVV